MALRALAPGRPFTGRPGAVFLAVSLLFACGACERGRRSTADDRHRLPLGSDTIELGKDVSVHEVRLGGAGAAAGVRPASVTARPGDVVRFVAADARGHAVAFVDSALPPDARDFLTRTRQMRGPPLISTGASWVVSLKDAPPGRYPFRSLTREATGEIVVQAAPAK